MHVVYVFSGLTPFLNVVYFQLGSDLIRPKVSTLIVEMNPSQRSL